MEEVLFHLSRRLETFQIWVSEFLETVGNHLESSVVMEQVLRLRVTAREAAERTTRLAADFASKAALALPHPSLLAERLASLIGPDMNRATLYAGCVGFTLGGSLGLVLGVFLQSPQSSPVTLMTAIAATSFTGVDSIVTLEDAIVPSISRPDEVLIEVVCATVDPLDIRISLGYARQLRKQFNRYNPNNRGELPVILGREGSGIVVEVGRSVVGLEVGDPVYFCTPAWCQGTLAQYVALSSYLVAKKPNKLGFEGAATIPYCGAVAWHAVVKTAGLTTRNAHKKRVLVHCGSSGAGWMVAQLCSTLGSHVTVTCLNRAAAVMKSLGATDVVPLETGDVERQLLTRNKFDVVFNTAGSGAVEFCSSVCAHSGMVVSTVTTPLASDRFGVFLGALYSIWTRMAHSVFGMDYWSSVALNAQVLGEVRKLVDSGRLQPVVDKIYAPADIEKALRHVDSANAIGKTVIRFSGLKSAPQNARRRYDRPDLLS